VNRRISKGKTMKRVVFFMALTGVLCCGLRAAAQMTPPARTAVISSSGVNDDFRSWNEYDDTLKSLGWAFDKYRNTELPALAKKIGDYNLILTTSLWNYGDPQDMTTYITAIRQYLNNGGIVVLTDMSYPSQCDWLQTMDPSLSLSYTDANKTIGAKSQLSSTQPSSIMKYPNVLNGFYYWAHYPNWGKRWTVLLQTEAGTALMLGAKVGRGALIATTTWALSGPALQNVYALAQQIEHGVVLSLNLPTAIPYPGTLHGDLTIRNIENTVRRIQLRFDVSGAEGEGQSQSRPILLPANEMVTERILFPIKGRGRFEVRVSPFAGLTLDQSCFVPPLLSIHCNRYILTRSDDLNVSVKISSAPDMLAKTRLKVWLKSGDKTVVLAQKPVSATNSFTVSGSKLSIGAWRLTAAVIGDGEKGSQETTVEVRNIKHPPSLCKVSRRGYILANGKPFFPLGVYHVGTDDLPTIRRMCFNCTTGPIYGSHETMMNDGEKAFMKEAHRQGLWVIQELSDYLRTPNRNFDNLRRIVSELRLQPATLFYYAIDEPDPNTLTPKRVSRECEVIQKADPQHPTYVLEVPGIVKYAQCGDITGVDPYPIGSSKNEDLTGFAQAIAYTVRAAQGRPVVVAIQAHRQPPVGSQNRYPTPEEIRCMSYLALNHGAKGLLFYAWSDAYLYQGKQWGSGFEFNPILRAAFPKLLAELRTISRGYMEGEVKQLPSPKDAPKLDIAFVKWKGGATVIAVNPTGNVIQTQLKIGGKMIKEIFEPYGVRRIPL